MKRKLILFTAAALAVFSLAGCGDKGSQQADNGINRRSTSTSETSEKSDKKDIASLFGIDKDKDKDTDTNKKKEASDYDEDTNLDIDVEGVHVPVPECWEQMGDKYYYAETGDGVTMLYLDSMDNEGIDDIEEAFEGCDIFMEAFIESFDNCTYEEPERVTFGGDECMKVNFSGTDEGTDFDGFVILNTDHDNNGMLVSLCFMQSVDSEYDHYADMDKIVKGSNKLTENAGIKVDKGSSTKSKNTSDAATGEKEALESALNYLKFTNFSYNGLISQLEYEEYTTQEATYAADNCGADWKEQALGSAKDYLEYSAFSYQGLYDQLLWEEYTEEEAQYAVDNCGADWNEQAVKCAEDYLEYMEFSRSELIDQLEFEGFTAQQAEYGVSGAGL